METTVFISENQLAMIVVVEVQGKLYLHYRYPTEPSREVEYEDLESLEWSELLNTVKAWANNNNYTLWSY